MWYKVTVSDEAQDHDGVEATAWRWLRELYLRLLCPANVHPGSMTEGERNLLLDKHHRAMEDDLRVVLVLVEQGKSEALGAWRERIHSTEGTDHEMLDEALDFAANRREDDD